MTRREEIEEVRREAAAQERRARAEQAQAKMECARAAEDRATLAQSKRLKAENEVAEMYTTHASKKSDAEDRLQELVEAEHLAESNARAALVVATRTRRLLAQAELGAEAVTTHLLNVALIREQLEELRLERCRLAV